MAGTQNYLGIKNGVVVCVDAYSGYDISGRFYHGYSTEPTNYRTGTELLTRLEQLFDLLNFPYAATSERTFGKEKKKPTRRVFPGEEKEKVMSDREVLEHHGDVGTFIVRVQQRQNSSWQGRITWVDKDKTLYFRSVWEMMKLIDSALGTEQEGQERTNWGEE